jgi:hypothetical protein
MDKFPVDSYELAVLHDIGSISQRHAILHGHESGGGEQKGVKPTVVK